MAATAREQPPPTHDGPHHAAVRRTSSPVEGSCVEEPYVEVRETHSAVVLLVGDRAVKFKKPVDLGFLDFSTTPKRLAACRREVALNRRLAPDVYLGVCDVVDPTSGPVEHLVVMRRMPAEARLAGLVHQRSDLRAEVRAVARTVAAFHERCARGAGIDVSGGRDALAARWRANLAEARRHRGTILPADAFDEVATLSERYLAGRGDLFAQRIARGAVVDGHGDLLAEDIFCLPDGPRILDCLDFDDRLRHLDRLDDLACLAMDLEHLGAPAAARALLHDYLELSGDTAPPSLVDHYTAYRAFMRAKVTCLRATQTGRGAREAAGLLDLAHRHLSDARVALVLVGGPPGTGKTTVASSLADRLGLVLLSSDRVRKELAGYSPETRHGAPYLGGIYSPGWTRRTYEDLLRRAGVLLRLGESVVLDATWADPGQRAAARALAEQTSSDLHQFRCDLPPELASARVSERTERTGRSEPGGRSGRPGPSDADADIALAVRRHCGAWPEASVLDTRRAVDDVVGETAARVRPPHRVAGARPRLAPD